LSVVVLEASPRVGGRALTLVPERGVALDLGCGWLHSAHDNVLAALAPDFGLAVDASDAPWTRPALTSTFPAADQKAYRRAFAAFGRRLERAAKHPEDAPASDFVGEADARWRPMLDAFSGYYNGAPLAEISVKDYAAYTPTEANWRVAEGYGVLMERLAEGLDIRLRTEVTDVFGAAEGVRVRTGSGDYEAAFAVIAVPTTVIAKERLRLDPSLAAKVDAAADLPLGNVEKAFLRLDGGPTFPSDTQFYGRTDVAETGSYTLRPRGMPIVECFFGGALAALLGEEDLAGVAAFAIEELVRGLGSDMRNNLRPLASSSWAHDPFIGGAYSHARVGCSGARAVLARPEGRLFFAGEACSAHAFSTAHGAFETGVAAANAAIAAFAPKSSPGAL
jgi:monoamine oxidase